MKPITYARIALFLPHLCLLEAVVYLYFQNGKSNENILYGINLAWFFLAIFWILPYSILALCLLIWSRGKPRKAIQDSFALAPFILIVVTLITYSIIYLVSSLYGGDFTYGLPAFISLSLISILASVILGYLFVGIAFLLFKLLARIGFIQDSEAQEPEDQSVYVKPITYSSEDDSRL